MKRMKEVTTPVTIAVEPSHSIVVSREFLGDVAHSAAHIAIGYAYVEQTNVEHFRALQEAEGLGFDGVMRDLSEWAIHMEAHWYYLLDETSGEAACDGVYAYDIPEEFGRWYATFILTLGKYPSDQECEAKIDALFEEHVEFSA